MDLKKKILIIEDDKDIRNFLARRMNGSGFQAFTAEDGLTGLEMAKRELPDVIILDLRLPNLSGEEVCKTIREDRDNRFAGIPIIMLTAKTADADRVVGRVIGASCYMTKPFRARQLIEQVQKFAQERVDGHVDF